MAIIVKKFGGTSVGSLERIEAVAEQIIATKQQGHQVVAVLSAMSGETNRLTQMAKQLDTNPSPRELDMLLSSGEQVSISLLAIALIKRGYSAVSLLAHQIGLQTNSRFNKARILDIDNTRMLTELQQGHIVIVAGFQGVDFEGNITTLGRGGSDTSAVAIATSLRAKECQIYTDVDGVYSTDPRVDANAKKLPHVSFDEMLEMASTGAKVLQTRSVEFAGHHKMPLHVLSSFSEGDGTQITFEQSENKSHPVTAITYLNDEVLFSISHQGDAAYIRTEIFAQLAENDIEIDMLSESQINDKLTDLQFTVQHSEKHKTELVLSQQSLKLEHFNWHARQHLVKISAIGNGMKSHCGVASEFFDCLKQQNIELFLVSTAEIKISVLVLQTEMERAVQALHKKFKLNC